jgi:hypothetical protein
VAFVIDAYARRIVGWRVSRTAHAVANASAVLYSNPKAFALRTAQRNERKPHRCARWR